MLTMFPYRGIVFYNSLLSNNGKKESVSEFDMSEGNVTFSACNNCGAANKVIVIRRRTDQLVPNVRRNFQRSLSVYLLML